MAAEIAKRVTFIQEVRKGGNVRLVVTYNYWCVQTSVV